MSLRAEPAWRTHWTVLGGLVLAGVVAAFALGTDHPHGLFDTGFFLIVVAIFGTAHGVASSLAVRKWGTTVARVLGLHAAILFGLPTLFGVVASIVS